MTVRVLKVRAQSPDLEILAEAASFLRLGKVIAFPTETVYGLGVIHRDAKAVERIYEIKARDRSKPLTYHLANFQFVNSLKFKEERVFHWLAKKFWPGPLTLIVQGEDGKSYGLRMPDHAVVRLLVELCGEPLLATSANISGSQAAVSPEEVLSSMEGKIDLLVDAGKCAHARASTIVDLTERPFRILREGAEAQKISGALKEAQSASAPKIRILIVCTGNTCRSPMAEGWLAAEIRKEELQEQIEVESCGIYAYKNMPPTEEAVRVLREDGIDISGHSARPLTPEMAKDADRIYAMGPDHEQFILRAYPWLSGKVRVLGIQDPMGQDLTAYRECYRAVKDAMGQEFKWIEERCHE